MTDYTITVPGLGTIEAGANLNHAKKLAKDYAEGRLSGRVEEGTVVVFQTGVDDPVAEYEVNVFTSEAGDRTLTTLPSHLEDLITAQIEASTEAFADKMAEIGFDREKVIKALDPDTIWNMIVNSEAMPDTIHMPDEADLDTSRDPDAHPSSNEWVWYGHGGKELADCATQVIHEGGSTYEVTEYRHVGGMIQNYDEDTPFLSTSTTVEASDHKYAARKGANKLADEGGDEAWAKELP